MEVIARDLETPWGLAFLPDGRLLVTERPGRLRMVEKGRLLAEPVTGTPKTWNEQDGGLLDVEVHPRYAENGWIYLSFAQPGPQDTSMTAVVRGRIRENRWVDEQAIYTPAPELFGAENYHYGSRFLFDRDGRLFFSIGDRGQKDAAQDLGRPLGKVHRVNDDGTVPADNPFVGRAGAVPTIWTYGHRNPQGLSIDPVSGLLWESEHGPMGGDELNILEAGHNYGWPVISHGIEPGITGTAHEGMEPPIVYWNPTIAPSGIHFYEGARYPKWRDDLFVTGLGGTALRRLEVKGRQVTHQEVLFNRYGRVRDVVTGPDGLLYVALQLPGAKLSSSTPGVVVRLVPIE
jgi:glucose/arabinose dehydrogenase